MFAKIEADNRFLAEPGKLDIVYSIDEGGRYRGGPIKIEIKGEAPHTMITTALNRLSVKPGDIIDPREIRAGGGPLKPAQLYNGVGVNSDAGLVGNVTLSSESAPVANPAPPAKRSPAADAVVLEVNLAVLAIDRTKLRNSAPELQRLGIDLDKLPATLGADKDEAVLTAMLRDGLAEVFIRPQFAVLSGGKASCNVGSTVFDVLPTVLDKERVRVECHLRKRSPTATFEFSAPLEMRLGRTMVVSGGSLQPPNSDKQIVVLMTVKVNQSPRADTAGDDYRLEAPDVVRVEATQFPGRKTVLEGLYLIGPDGTINLRDYGTPHVAGLTERGAEQRIVEAVSHSAKGKSSVDYAARVRVESYNSKAVYLMLADDSVRRLPVTNSCTVASVILQVEGAAAKAAKGPVWLVRPSADHVKDTSRFETKQIDWAAIVGHGSVEANLRLMPGDRIYIGSRPPETNARPPSGRDAPPPQPYALLQPQEAGARPTAAGAGRSFR